ncbi:MAG: hypothetical protein JRG69_08810 [Deltaproteobacteria bacterium]|nr:hypothetical protein [Deltaproteobacteria bacterium]
MDATITNLSTERVFIPGPQLDMAPTGDPAGGDVKLWSEITVTDIDSNTRIKELVVAGTISVQMDADSYDAALATQGSLNFAALPMYLFADLPTGYNGRMAFVSNGRKGAEGAGVGTGLPCYYDATAAGWFTFSGDIAVTV